MPTSGIDNRHSRRLDAKLKNSRKWDRKKRTRYVNADENHWNRRIIGAFIQNARVINRLLDGKFDSLLVRKKKRG